VILETAMTRHRPDILAADFMIPSDTPGIELFVRNKRPAGAGPFGPERTVLFVHGSSYPAETAFDLELDGLSWMDFMAARGFDVYLVDVRGYGRSTRPPEMAGPAEAGPPIVRTETAVRDVGAAVQFILQRNRLSQLCLIGWSWGTTLMGSYTAAHNAQVHKLVLLAPQWLRTTPSASDMGGELGVYRTIAMADAKERWLRGVPAEQRDRVLPPHWFKAWAEATFATDPWGGTGPSPTLRAPNGTVQDSREYWAAGKPVYDPGKITVPVLIVHAEWDQDLPLDMARTYFGLLKNAPYRRWVELGEGTHSLHLEKNRMQVFQAVQGFLEEDYAPAY
jgi:pimeloyl-ACP methyl ester carboxylesterase